MIPDWLLPAIFAILIAGVTTILSSYMALRNNVRQKAWASIYEDKRNEIRGYISTLHQFPNLVERLEELKNSKAKSNVGRGTTLILSARKQWGLKIENPDDAVSKTFANYLSTLAKSKMGAKEWIEALEGAEKMLFVSINEDILDIIKKLRELRATLNLYIHKPKVLIKAEQFISEVVNELYAGTYPADDFDYQRFRKRWNLEIGEIVSLLRSDLNRSSKSLNAAIKLSEE